MSQSLCACSPYGRETFAEIGCTSDSNLAGGVLQSGGTATRYANWNGFDLTTSMGWQALLADLHVRRPRHIWFKPPAGSKFKSVGKISRDHRSQKNVLIAIKDLIVQPWCETLTVVQPARSEALGPRGHLKNLREQLHNGMIWGCQWNSVDLKTGLPFDKSWQIMSTSRDMVQMLTSRRCPGRSESHAHVPCVSDHQAQNFPMPMVRKVVKYLMQEPQWALAGTSSSSSSMPVESFRAAREAQATGTRTGSDSHTPARPLTAEEQSAWDLLDEPERKKCTAIVSHLHELRGHTDIRAMVDALSKEHAHPTIMAAAKLLRCSACEEAKPKLSRPVTSDRVTAPAEYVGFDGFQWKHPSNGQHCRAILIGDRASKHCIVSVGKETNYKDNLGNYTGAQVPKILQNEWVRHYSRPKVLQFDPEGAFVEDAHFKTWMSSQSICPDVLPGEASWKLGPINKMIDSVKEMATKLAKRLPDDITAQEIFDAVTIAHSDLHRQNGFAPCQLMMGRTPAGIGVTEPRLGEASAVLASEPMQKLLQVQREAYHVYLDHHKDVMAHKLAVHRSRPFSTWASGEWCWCWRQGKQTGQQRQKG